MIIRHKELVKQGKSPYQIKKMVDNKELFFIRKGVYSTDESLNYFEMITKKHPNAVFTLDTACYIYRLKKDLGQTFYIATKQKDRKIKTEYIKQIFTTDELYNIGISNITYQNVNIKVYDLERLLIEVVRNKINIKFETYKEIIDSYSKIKKLLNTKKLELYLSYFKNPKISERIEKEVFKK